MAQFINIWPGDVETTAVHKCLSCGRRVYGLDGIRNHNCEEPDDADGEQTTTKWSTANQSGDQEHPRPDRPGG